MVDLYTNYLIASFLSTAISCSGSLHDAVSHKQIIRYLTERLNTSRNLWRLYDPLVRQVENTDSVLALDDTNEERPYTAENDRISWHFDALKHRVVKGTTFLNTFYQLGEAGSLVAFGAVSTIATYNDVKKRKNKRRSETTKGKHPFASLCTDTKLENLKIRTKRSPSALKSKLIDLAKLKTVCTVLIKFNPQLLAT
jgi:hypothetical protein